MIVLLLADAIFGTVEISMPSVGAGLRALSLRLFVPLGLVVLTRWSLAGSDEIESRSDRHVGLADSAVVAAMIAAHLGESVIVRGGMSLDSLVGVRGTAGLLGVALVERHLTGPRAATIVPAAYVLVSAMFGAEANGGSAWWAWPASPHVTSSSLMIAGILCIAGVVTTATQPIRAS